MYIFSSHPLPSFCSDYFKFDTYINKYINIIAKIMDSVE